MTTKAFFWSAGILFLFPALVLAHAMEGVVSYQNGVGIISVAYDDGEPASYVKVVIRAPGSKFSFQRGRTDRNGRFAFLPNTPGLWQIVVSDNMGHRAKLILKVKGKPKKPKDNKQVSSSVIIPRKVAALLGVLAIWGFFSLLKGLFDFSRNLF